MFKKYMHVERVLSDEVDGILIGTVQIQPKLDGANAQIWRDPDTNVICYGSRNQEGTGSECMGLGTWVKDNFKPLLSNFFTAHPTWRLYGEWLIPHTLKTYRTEVWQRFYVFDVLDDTTDEFVPYTEYQTVLAEFGFDYIPVLATITNPTVEALQKFLEKNMFLIEDGKGAGEGIVIKRYDFKNRFGRTVWAKIVRNEFKEQHVVTFGASEVKCGVPDEVVFAQELVTRGRLDKALADLQPWTSKRIPELFGRVYHELVTTEMWDFIKSRKNKVKIDFGQLNQHVIAQIKAVYPELF